MNKLQFANPIWMGGNSRKVNYHSEDSPDRCLEQYAIHGEKWNWKDRDLTYTLNSQGYRCEEFDKIDWQKSIVVIGCSYVFGVGLDDDQTLASCLNSKLSTPVINLGISGSSIPIALANLLAIIENYDQPKSVINLWTEYSRLPFWDDQTRHIGAWTKTKDKKHSGSNINILNNLFNYWNYSDNNPKQWARIFRSAAREILKSRGIKHLEGSMFRSTAELFDIPYFKCQDFARDGLHPGPKTIECLSSKISKLLIS